MFIEVPYFMQVPSQAVEGEMLTEASIAYVNPELIDIIMPLATPDKAGNTTVLLLETGTTVLANIPAADVAAIAIPQREAEVLTND